MTWPSLIWKNLLRRRARTVFTAVGVGVGVGLIVALFAITNGVHQTASDLMHLGGADFGLYQSDVTDFTTSLLPESMAAKVAADPGVDGGRQGEAPDRGLDARVRLRPVRVRLPSVWWSSTVSAER